MNNLPEVPTPKGERKRMAGDDAPWHQDAIGLGAARTGNGCGTGMDVVVAIVDTGVDATHPDLQGKVLATYEVDEAGNLLPLPNPGVNHDGQGHGTSVAGLICGQPVGVAPDARLVSIILPDPASSNKYSSLVLALTAVTQLEGVDIVNISAAVAGYFSPVRAFLQEMLAQEMLPVMAVGNGNPQVDRPMCPGNLPEGVSVGAMGRDRRVCSFSLSGEFTADGQRYTVPDVVAPGEDVYTCQRGGGYRLGTGTSYATPIASGVAALLLEGDPALPAEDLRTTLLANCVELADPPERQGAGLVQVP
jgi:subtilisin family serine protease